jgi:hypothetical protein
MNKLNVRILTLSKGGLENTISEYFKQNNKTVNQAVALATKNFKNEVYTEMKNKKGGAGLAG